jgi:hypothetical protein
MYTVTLSDGTKIENLSMNGNNFVSNDRITEAMFENKLSRVTVNDGENETTYEKMVLVQVTQMGDEYWFILRERTTEEIAEQEITDMQLALADVYEMLMGGV